MRPSFEFIKRNLGENLVGVEIGVNRGKHAEELLKGLDFKKLYLVDIWDKRAYYIKHGGILTDEKMYQYVLRTFKDNDKVEIIRKCSVEAAPQFEDESLDFAYIDADHSYEAVIDDINAWYPKVRERGVLCGHDYHPAWKGVIKATNELADKNDWYLFQEKDDWWIIK